MALLKSFSVKGLVTCVQSLVPAEFGSKVLNVEKTVLGESQESNFYLKPGIDKIYLAFDKDGFLCYLSIKDKEGKYHDFKGNNNNNNNNKVKPHKVTFKNDEQLFCIRGTTCRVEGDNTGKRYITGLAIMTTKREHGPYGSLRGEPFTETAEAFCFVIQFTMNSFGGRLVSIGNIFSERISSHLQCQWLPTKSGVYGGLKGTYWDSKPKAKTIISHITIYHSKDAVHAITIITTTKDKGRKKSKTFGSIPALNCERKEIPINQPRERIVKITGTFGEHGSVKAYVVNSLTIHTNLNKDIGTKDGVLQKAVGRFVYKPFTFIDKDAAIVGFHGFQEGNKIKSIGVYYRYLN